MKAFTKLAMAAAVLFCAAGVSACNEPKEDKPAGNTMEKAADEPAETMNDTTEDDSAGGGEPMHDADDMAE